MQGSLQSSQQRPCWHCKAWASTPLTLQLPVAKSHNTAVLVSGITQCKSGTADLWEQPDPGQLNRGGSCPADGTHGTRVTNHAGLRHSGPPRRCVAAKRLGVPQPPARTAGAAPGGSAKALEALTGGVLLGAQKWGGQLPEDQTEVQLRK
jgi:hypothetical protein